MTVSLDWIPVVIIGIAFVLDLLSTIDLYARYRRVGPSLKFRERLILQSYVVIAVVVTIIAGYVGALATRRLMGFEPLDQLSIVSWALSLTAMFIPTYLRLTLHRVAAEPRD